MPDHYYTAVPTSESRTREVSFSALGRTFTFLTDAGVFSKDGLDPGTRLLMESCPPLSGDTLDLGCGWGALGVPLAAVNPDARFLLSDVNVRAVSLARENIARNGIGNARAVESDGFTLLPARFDHILTNPPIRAGKAVIYALFAEASVRLAPGGTLTLVIRKQQGAPSAKAYLAERFSTCEVIAHGGGYWILHCQKQAQEDTSC